MEWILRELNHKIEYMSVRSVSDGIIGVLHKEYIYL